MKKLNRFCLFGTLFLLVVIAAPAALVVNIAPPKSTGSEAVVKLDLQNTFDQKIKAVDAAIFLVDIQGKVVGQTNAWIIGGPKNRPALEPAGKGLYYFVEQVSVLTIDTLAYWWQAWGVPRALRVEYPGAVWAVIAPCWGAEIWGKLPTQAVGLG